MPVPRSSAVPPRYVEYSHAVPARGDGLSTVVTLPRDRADRKIRGERAPCDVSRALLVHGDSERHFVARAAEQRAINLLRAGGIEFDNEGVAEADSHIPTGARIARLRRCCGERKAKCGVCETGDIGIAVPVDGDAAAGLFAIAADECGVEELSRVVVQLGDERVSALERGIGATPATEGALERAIGGGEIRGVGAAGDEDVPRAIERDRGTPIEDGTAEICREGKAVARRTKPSDEAIAERGRARVFAARLPVGTLYHACCRWEVFAGSCAGQIDGALRIHGDTESEIDAAAPEDRRID